MTDTPTPEQIRLLEESRINLRVTPAVFARLNDKATYHGKSIEEYCAEVLVESLDELIGKPFIDGCAKFSGQDHTGKKITGPTFSTRRV